MILLTGPAVFIVSTLLARSARGAVGTAIVDLEPGSSPGQLRDALALAIGDSTLQLAFRLPASRVMATLKDSTSTWPTWRRAGRSRR